MVCKNQKVEYSRLATRFQEAAAIPEVWLTAYQLLRKVANMTQGETGMKRELFL
jgi:hypothetical protein